MTGSTLTTIIDLGAIGVIAVCALIGRKLGMIRMLSGLITLILAMVGASYIAANFSGPLADAVSPAVEEQVAQRMEDVMSGENFNNLISGYVQQETRSAQEDAQENLSDVFSQTDFGDLKFDYFTDLFSKLSEQATLPQWITDGMSERIEEMRRSFTGTVSQALASAVKEILRPIFYGLLYAVSFFGLSVALRLAFKLLNPLTDAPGVRTINAGGGLALGVLQGLVILIAASFILRFAFGSVDGVSDSRLLALMGQVIPPLRFQ